MNIQSIIAKRRDGEAHTREELEFLASGAAKGEIADYQLSAWLMAAYLSPLNPEETAWLTLAMAGSGERLDLTGLPKPWVDKHSTGGVGDKTTIVLAPLLAACGLTVLKMSGRGLGITGGTVDKLASVPGFKLDLSPQELKEQAGRIGLALTGQTPNLAPADKVLYSLRDATATVGSIPLIVSSILSKKIAGGAETIVLDVKAGSGAFMKSEAAARELAEALKRTIDICSDLLAGATPAPRRRLNARLAITDMSQPLGRAVGNALEVAEAIEVLGGQAGGRLHDLCIRLAGVTLAACGLADSIESGVMVACERLEDGSAFRKAEEWFRAHGSTADLHTLVDVLPKAPVQQKVFWQDAAGWAATVDAETVGQTVVELGGGRKRKEDTIDPSVGVEAHVEVGDRVEHSQLLFTVHASSQGDADAAAHRLLGAVEVVDREVAEPELVLDVL